MGIKSKSDAVEYLLDKFTNKDKDYRIMNAISGAALGGAYTVTDSATGKPEVEEHNTKAEAEEHAKYLNSQGRKTFVVTPDDYELPLQL